MIIKVYTEVKKTLDEYIKCKDKPIIYYGSIISNYFETIYNGNNCNLNDYIKNGRNKIIK